ncbi:putative mitochondrial hypothetical protein [Leptomonas pyrrhocoris]|uniref:Uncharacterized protein n=1 Tax=Leptomonas pyrrhocoris TaxID=157538 RepID=A0A0N0DV38_LEPPY|nr:putative mitochondrial hypothetical protein [Leptomonas pyrrhocoris]XP_015658211.1 putative mitochondrial hypothetical protein [Leptomonas pyrrhocoris]KPA79771.1 putative mitochondrial hypothetical protein [Leptomonas pyrrhocoris]KPA79772.1 putative mitochondrial hypothetical protein [Leptomonas pyrrhocoris]|eukprot:XP_015658210.1 putative mitochondrial hypothetical protein [Leptomonas pyrrhocoris]
MEAAATATPAASEPAPTATPPAPATAPTARAVHPAARWLARLFSPMSLKDQEYCSNRFQVLLWGSLLVSFPVAYWMGNVLITMGTVCASTVVCLVLFGPNWYQHPDPLLKYADDTDVYEYYQQYEAAKKAAREPATAPSTTDTKKGASRAATPANRKV